MYGRWTCPNTFVVVRGQLCGADTLLSSILSPFMGFADPTQSAMLLNCCVHAQLPGMGLTGASNE